MFHFKKHVDANHGLIVTKFGKELKNNLKSPFERQLTKKRPIMNASATSNFFGL
jgi:hypothetical protein